MTSVAAKAHAGLLLTNAIFAIWFIMGKLALTGTSPVNPFVFALYRELGATVCMVLFSYLMWRRAPTPVFWAPRPGRDRWLLAAGVCGTSTALLGCVNALDCINAGVYAAYLPSVPILTELMCVGMKLMKPARRRLLALALTISGAMVIALAGSRISAGKFQAAGLCAELDRESANMLGNVLAAGASAGLALSLVSQRLLLGPSSNVEYPSHLVTMWNYLGTTLVVLVATLIRQPALSELSLHSWLNVAALGYAVVFTAFVAFEILAFVLKHVDPTTVALYNGIQPPATAILSAIFLGTQVSALDGLGFVLVACGLLINAWPARDSSATDAKEELLDKSEVRSGV